MRKSFDIEITYEDDSGESSTEKYKAVPNFAARSIVEERIGAPLIIMQRIAKMDIRLTDLVCVIYACILSGDNNPVSESKIGEALNSVGIDVAAEIALPLLNEWVPIGEKKSRKTTTVSRKKRSRSR